MVLEDRGEEGETEEVDESRELSVLLGFLMGLYSVTVMCSRNVTECGV